MVTTKRCAYGTCRNDSRYPRSWKRNLNGDPVKFFHFPGAHRQNERRQRWITACHRGDTFVCTKDSYICSTHFVGGNGPTKEYPDPISAIASKEKVKRLNRKRKASDEREADKERSKKICLERSAAKTLLTLHLHTGKSIEEHEAAGTLLDLSLESVVSAKEAEIEGLQEMEEQIIDQFPEPLPDDEPITSHVDRDTQTDKKMLRECGTQTSGTDKLMKMLFMMKVMDPQKTYHYTGMSKECLELIYGEVKEKSQRMNVWKGSRKTKTGKLQDRYMKNRKELAKLTSKEQFVFTLVRLRRNPSLEMLCDIFGITTGTGSRIFITWILFLGKELLFLLLFQQRRN
ncbi:uncharacterized protein [Montipora capricornis]|uniref:uncharacterized protein isoform X1 n=1 Tax=Montipora capricornis TaxID=246305 RepID=UPI0035F20DFF